MNESYRTPSYLKQADFRDQVWCYKFRDESTEQLSSLLMVCQAFEQAGDAFPELLHFHRVISISPCFASVGGKSVDCTR